GNLDAVDRVLGPVRPQAAGGRRRRAPRTGGDAPSLHGARPRGGDRGAGRDAALAAGDADRSAHEAACARGRVSRARGRRRGGPAAEGFGVSQLRSFLALYRGHLLAYRRARTAIYWSLAFPLFFLLMFGFVFGRGNPEDTRFVMPGLFTITIISGSGFGIATRVVTERETGILRRQRVTPVSGVAVVLAHAATALTTLMLSLALQLVVARALFKFHIVGSWPAFVPVLLLAGAALIPIGLIVGSV